MRLIPVFGALLMALAMSACGKDNAGNTERRGLDAGHAVTVADQKAGEQGEKANGDTFRDCKRCPVMVVVPAGSFLMGSPASEEGRTKHEEPVHRVTIAAPFAAGAYEVTFKEWDVCVAEGGCGDYGAGRGKRPVVEVSWDDAQAYVLWLSQKTGHSYRLLSEAEWEYAARAGTTTRYHTGDFISTDQANFNGVWIGQPARDELLPVGSFPANAFGLHDMHGNATEWVQDCWNENYEGAPGDGSAWETGDCSRRILRDCSYADRPICLRSASRAGLPKARRSPGWGFRVARSLALVEP